MTSLLHLCVVSIHFMMSAECSRIAPETFLEWLLHPYSTDEFITNHLHSNPVHIKRSFRDYYDLLQLNDLNNPISDEVQKLEHDGNGILSMYHMETNSTILRHLARSFTDFVPSCYVRTYLFQIPEQEKKIQTHPESSDLFILQIRGQRRWRVSQFMCEESVSRKSTEDDSCQTTISNEDSHPTHSIMGSDVPITLEAGDLLYIPHSHLYETIADPPGTEGNESVHIVLEVQSELYADYLYDLISYLFAVCKQCKQWLLEQYLSSGGGEAGGVEGIEYLNENLEEFLKCAAFMNNDLTKPLPYWFICGSMSILDETDSKLFILFERILPEFIQFLTVQQHKEINEEQIRKLVGRIDNVLKRKSHALYLQLKMRICMKQKRTRRALSDILEGKSSQSSAKSVNYKRISRSMVNVDFVNAQ